VKKSTNYLENEMFELDEAIKETTDAFKRGLLEGQKLALADLLEVNNRHKDPKLTALYIEDRLEYLRNQK
jgi:hypothetical protein